MSSMLIQTIAVASTGKTSGVDTVEAMDEMYTTQICLQKDAIFDLAGTVTSFLNSNINMVDKLVQTSGVVGAMFKAPKIQDVGEFVDSEYRDAGHTMVLSAVTRFLGNVGLGAVYPMLVARKMMICQSNDLVKIFSISGMTLTITSPRYEDAYDSMTGTCMTDFEEDNVAAADDSGVNAALDGIMAWLGTIPYANYKHVIDAGLSYVMSLIRGLQDMVQVSDIRNCKLRDASVEQQGQCACGDDAVMIPPERAKQGTENSAFWCTGFLSMQTPFGTPLYVFNPYTYDVLRGLAGKTDLFLECIATEKAGDCIDLEPKAPDILSRQGAALLPVLARCHANYQAMQWDAGASHLYEDIDLMEEYLFVVKTEIKRSQTIALRDKSLSVCMKATLVDNVPNDGCLQQHLADPAIGLRRQDYFLYGELQETRPVDTTTSTALRYPTHMIAACLVFTGPAKIEINGVNVSESFRRCTNPETMTGAGGLPCELEGYVWSSTSRNSVPIAEMHSVSISSQKNRNNEAMNKYVDIHKDVMKALNYANATWTTDNLKMSLFTAEGDWLHQAFDCAILGPFGRADLSPRDLDEKLPALEYFRDSTGGTTRDFVLPCSGEELKGDLQAPFTCGSDVRRSIIKSFVRETYSVNENGDDALKEAVADQIDLLFQSIKDAFNVASRLACECPQPGKFGAECCASSLGFGGNAKSLPEQIRELPGDQKADVMSRFVPSKIRDLHFTSIQNSNSLGDNILDMVFEFLETEVWKNVTKTMAFDYDNTTYGISGQTRLLAASDAMYQTTRPLTTYDANDAFDETTTSSAFEVCMGAMS